MNQATTSPRRAFVTGITGQDGSYLAEFLLEKGYEVHGLARRVSWADGRRFGHLDPSRIAGAERLFVHRGDITDSATLSRLILEIEPDEIYNLAAQSHVQVSFDSPTYTVEATGLGALKVLEAAKALDRRRRVKVYQASSSEMFGEAPPPQNEKTLFHPRSPYGCAKVFAFHQTVNYREAHGLFACNGILFNHESPRRGEDFVTRKITRHAALIREGLVDRLRLGNLAARRDWGYAPDYVRAMWLMLQQDQPDDFVIATGVARTVADFALAAFAHFGLDYREYVVSDPRLLRPAEANHLVGDASKAASVLGWRPTTRFESWVAIMADADLELAHRERRDGASVASPQVELAPSRGDRSQASLPRDPRN